MFSLFVLIAIVILASSILSMVEAAILSLPLIRARMLYQEKRRSSKALLDIKEDIHTTIAAIVIVSNAISIVGSIFIGEKVSALFGDDWLGFFAFCLTVLVIIFGEVIPKTIGERYKSKLSLFFAPVIRAMVFFLRPVVKLILMLEKPLTRNLGVSPMPKVTEEEIRMMLQLGRDAGTVEMDEEQLCNRVFKLNDTRAAQIMRPISEIITLPADKTLGELRNEIVNCPYSRIAVHDKDPKDFVGMVQHRTLLREIANDNSNARIRDFMTQPIFVNAQTRADHLLEMFQRHNQHLFIVQDMSGRDVGLVTMEDVLEELFGEIYDEKDIHHRRVTDPQERKPQQ